MKHCTGIIAIILALAALSPLHYALLKFFPPDNLVFNGFGDDDALILTSIKYAEFGFKSPWVLPSDGIDDSVFLNPANGPVYITTVLSPFYLISEIDPLLLFVLYKFFASVLALTAVFYLFKSLLKSGKACKTAFLIFALSAGFGGLIYMVFALATNPSGIFYPFTLFGFGVGAFRILDFYQSLPFGLAVLSLLLFRKKKIHFSAASLALSTLFYPVYGLGGLISIFLYWYVAEKTESKNAVIILFSFAVGALPWAYAYAKQPFFFSVYLGVVQSASINIMLSILLGLGLPLGFLIYYLGREKISWSIKNRVVMVVLWLAATILISLSGLSQSLWIRFGSLTGFFSSPYIAAVLSFVNSYSILFDALFLILALIAIRDILRSKAISSDVRFVLLWFFVVLFVVAFPSKITAIVQPKIVGVLALPVSMIAAWGVVMFSKKNKVGIVKIIVLIFLVSLPSVVFYYSFNQSFARDVYDGGSLKAQTFYLSPDDVKAFEALREFPDGVVLSSEETGTVIPYYTNKMAILHNYNYNFVFNYDAKKTDVDKFYSSTDIEAKIGILKKYGVKYVFWGTFERQKYSEPDLSFMSILYKSGNVSIYEV